MKYSFIILLIFASSFSCKSKKQHSSSAPIRDTAFVLNPKTGEQKMHVVSENKSPEGSWTLQVLDDKTDEELNRISLLIDLKEKRASGNDACNQYTGEIKLLEKNKIEFGPMASTKRACMIPAKFAQLYYGTMSRVKSFAAIDNYLILKDENQARIMQFVKKEEEK